MASTNSQSYYLRFSSHSAALSRSLLGLLSEQYCTDVHISTGHQSQTIRAHKIILSAFSPYFKSLFSSLPSNQFPVIIIREIQYDILRTIVEFCYRGEILVSRDKLDDIVSAAKFLQIEGAKDFILPKGQHQSAGTQATNHSASSALISANNRISAQNNVKQPQTLLALQQQHRTGQNQSLLSKLVQKPPLIRPPADQTPVTSTDSQPLESRVKEEVLDEEGLDEEEEDLDEALDKSEHKSGMFAEFEENNKNNNESVRHSEDSTGLADDEPMDTAMGHILAKVPAGTSVSTTQHNRSDVPTHGSEDAAEAGLEEEEEEYEDEFDEEEEECDSTNPLDLLNVNMSETDDPLSGADLSSAAARAIAASTLASFGTGLDMDSETSQSSQYGQSSMGAVSASGERRGRGRPPKYEVGNVFAGQASSTSTSTVTSASAGTPSQMVITAEAVQLSPQHSQQQSISFTASSLSGDGSTAGTSRSRRGRPPSMPEEMLRSLTGRLDKAHHKCPHCPQIYYGYHAMRDHITSVHLNSGEKYICNLCNKEYTWRITLRKHLKFHHGVHPDQVGNA